MGAALWLFLADEQGVEPVPMTAKKACGPLYLFLWHGGKLTIWSDVPGSPILVPGGSRCSPEPVGKHSKYKHKGSLAILFEGKNL